MPMQLTRFPDWRIRLAAFIEANRSRRFDWEAAHNCGTFAADLAMAITGGPDIAGPFRHCHTRFSAARQLMRLGHRSIVEYFDAILPQARRPLLGDFVVLHRPPLDLVMVYAGRGQVWGQGDDGLELIPLADSALAWSI